MKPKPDTMATMPTANSTNRITVTSERELDINYVHHSVTRLKGCIFSPAENCQSRFLTKTRAANTPRPRVLFIVAAPYS